jgi:hypothetical protein
MKPNKKNEVKMLMLCPRKFFAGFAVIISLYRRFHFFQPIIGKFAVHEIHFLHDPFSTFARRVSRVPKYQGVIVSKSVRLCFAHVLLGFLRVWKIQVRKRAMKFSRLFVVRVRGFCQRDSSQRSRKPMNNLTPIYAKHPRAIASTMLRILCCCTAAVKKQAKRAIWNSQEILEVFSMRSGWPFRLRRTMVLQSDNSLVTGKFR